MEVKKGAHHTLLFVCANFTIGGVGKILNFVAENSVKSFDKVVIVSMRGEARPSWLHQEIDYETITPDFNRGMIIWRSKAISQLRKIIRKIKPDIICPFGSEVAVMTVFSTRWMKRGKILSAERCDPYTSSFAWRILIKLSYFLSDYCVFQLEGARDYYGNILKNKSFVIPNPYIPKISINVADINRTKTIVSAGRFVEQKGFEVLIDAFKEVNKHHPDYTLKIYGEGELLDFYKQRVKNLDLDGFVSFPGYTSIVEKEIINDGIFVLPSRFEGIPNVLIEAMATGIPTVSTDCPPGGPRFLTNGGERGLLVSVDNYIEMANAICKLIEHPEVAKKIGESGCKIREILSEVKIARQWANMFSLILK